MSLTVKAKVLGLNFGLRTFLVMRKAAAPPFFFELIKMENRLVVARG